MKMPFLRAVAGAIAGVAIAGFSALADGNHQHATTNAATPPAERKIKYYRNPMGTVGRLGHPQEGLYGDGLHPRL